MAIQVTNPHVALANSALQIYEMEMSRFLHRKALEPSEIHHEVQKRYPQWPELVRATEKLKSPGTRCATKRPKI